MDSASSLTVNSMMTATAILDRASSLTVNWMMTAAADLDRTSSLTVNSMQFLGLVWKTVNGVVADNYYDLWGKSENEKRDLNGYFCT